MALDPSNGSSLEQLALKGLMNVEGCMQADVMLLSVLFVHQLMKSA